MKVMIKIADIGTLFHLLAIFVTISALNTYIVEQEHNLHIEHHCTEVG